MAKKKLIHFQENLTFSHLFQLSHEELLKGFHLKDQWNKNFFRNDNSIILELGCGKGEYTTGLAERYDSGNFIGIDLKGARLWRGCRTVQDKGLRNVAFIRTRVDHVESIFGKEEVSEIWITFPDPQPGKARKRLTSPFFIDKYRKILKKENIVHLKTDDQSLYIYTRDVIKDSGLELLYATDDLYQSGFMGEASALQTFYEQMWIEKGKKICYLQFRIR